LQCRFWPFSSTFLNSASRVQPVCLSPFLFPGVLLPSEFVAVFVRFGGFYVRVFGTFRSRRRRGSSSWR
jgi:hypothetical protein